MLTKEVERPYNLSLDLFSTRRKRIPLFELLIAQGKEMTAKSLRGQHKEFKLVVKQRKFLTASCRCYLKD